MAFNIADLFENVVDVVPDRLALVAGDKRRTFAELDARANRLAHHLSEAGVGVGDRVGVYGQNSVEWIEAMYAAFKIRAIPVNVNFRYVADELVYIFDNADMVAVIHDREFTPRIAEIRDRVPTLRHLVVIDDHTDPSDPEFDAAELGSVPYEEALESASAERDFPERSPDDLYVLYTGGTTGMPKGVRWRQEDVFFALGQGIDALTGERAEHDKSLAAKAPDSGLVFCIIPPLMHGAAQWGTMGQHFQGNTIVLVPKFSAAAVWELIEQEKCNSILITGDAMGRPLIEHLEAHPEIDASSLVSVSSSAAVFSVTVKDRFLERFEHLIITDSIGSSESGFNGMTMVGKGQTMISGGGPTVTPGPDVVIFDEEMNVIEPGDETVGKIGRTGNIPLGYHKDEAKTAATFVVAPDGTRYAIPGDWAKYEGTDKITLLGRGSVSINSGGEKIFPEEVEQALKDHPSVFDCLVVGVPDERWGQRVAAVVEFREGMETDLEDLVGHARTLVAGYKVPRELHVVDQVRRSPSGKPDYPWAKDLASQ